MRGDGEDYAGGFGVGDKFVVWCVLPHPLLASPIKGEVSLHSCGTEVPEARMGLSEQSEHSVLFAAKRE